MEKLNIRDEHDRVFYHSRFFEVVSKDVLSIRYMTPFDKLQLTPHFLWTNEFYWKRILKQFII